MWYAISFVLAVAVALLAWYLLQLKRAAREIADAFAEGLRRRMRTVCEKICGE